MNIDNIIKKISDTVASHKLENDGEYTRWLWQNDDNSRELGLNEYGCADAVNILYTIGEFPNTTASKEAHIKTLQAFQSPETGLFTEATHHPIHTTAHCIAALELFDAVLQSFSRHCPVKLKLKSRFGWFLTEDLLYRGRI